MATKPKTDKSKSKGKRKPSKAQAAAAAAAKKKKRKPIRKPIVELDMSLVPGLDVAGPGGPPLGLGGRGMGGPPLGLNGDAVAALRGSGLPGGGGLPGGPGEMGMMQMGPPGLGVPGPQVGPDGLPLAPLAPPRQLPRRPLL